MKDVLFYALFLIFNSTAFGFNSLLLDIEENITFQDCFSNFVLQEFTENFPICYIHDGSKLPIILHNGNNLYVTVNINQPMKKLKLCSRYYVLQAENEQTLKLIASKLIIWKRRYTSSKTNVFIIAPTSKINLKPLLNIGVTYITLFNYTNKIYTCDPYHKLNQCGQTCNYLVEHRCKTSKIHYETANRSFKNCSILFYDDYLNDTVKSQNVITRFILREFENYLGLSIETVNKLSSRFVSASLMLFLIHSDSNVLESDSIFTDSFGWVTFISKVPSTQILQYIFERKVWIFLGITFSSVSLMWCFIIKLTTNKWNVSTSFVNVLALTLVGCVTSIPQIRALKCLTFFYLMFVIVIHGAFKTNLAKLLTADQYNNEIKTLEDLVDSDIAVCTHQSIIAYSFNEIIEEDTIYTKIREKILPIQNDKDILDYINCTYLLLLQDVHALKDYSSGYKFNYFINNRLTGDVKYRFIFFRYNYLSDRLNNFIQCFVENGISEHIISENNRKRYGYGKQKEEKPEPNVLTMHHAYGIFVIWAILGYLFTDFILPFLKVSVSVIIIMPLNTNDTFDSYKELQDAVDLYEKENRVQFWKRDAKTITSAKHHALNLYKTVQDKELDLKYYYIKYACIHGGQPFRPKNKQSSIKNCRNHDGTYKQDCNASITVGLKDRMLVIKNILNNHNHEIPTSEIFRQLPKQRRLSNDNKSNVKKLMRLKQLANSENIIDAPVAHSQNDEQVVVSTSIENYEIPNNYDEPDQQLANSENIMNAPVETNEVQGNKDTQTQAQQLENEKQEQDSLENIYLPAPLNVVADPEAKIQRR
ncbi:hypothetical protein FQA39_LY11170 [Lamprigera yunnana]|nr:hypothetical protein FQA39_LY11170 [Lamprigera yunnana]